MLADLAHQRLAVVLGHPVLRLDEVAGVDARVEALPASCISSAERTAFGASSRSLPIVSIACVYMAVSFAAYLRPLVDTRRALPISVRSMLSGATDVDRGRDADQRLDALLQPSARSRARGSALGVRRAAARSAPRPRRECLAGDDELVLARELAVREHDLLDLRREHVDAADDQHVVAAADDLAHAAHRARGRRQQARQVARAVADDRQRFLGERREDELALLAVGQHLAGLGVDDLGIEVVFPDRPGRPWSRRTRWRRPGPSLPRGRRCRPRRCRRWLSISRAHRLGPRLGAEDADLERLVARVDAPGARTPRSITCM